MKYCDGNIIKLLITFLENQNHMNQKLMTSEKVKYHKPVLYHNLTFIKMNESG